MTTRDFLFACAGLFIAGALFQPPVTHAQTNRERRLFIEPGTSPMPASGGGAMQGKIVVDLDTGEVYGFPTAGKFPFPGDQLSEGRPRVSSPVYLGRYKFEAMRPTSQR